MRFSINNLTNYRLMKAFLSALLLSAMAVSLPMNAAGVQTENLQRSVPDDVSPRKGHIIGKVQDRNGVALPGVAVMIKGTSIGTETNTVGNYDLDLKGRSSGVIVFSCLGYSIQEINYTGQTHMNVTLQDDAQALNEIVVTGYGNYNRSEYVGAVTQIKADDILVPGELTIDQMLQGVVPGMSVINTTGKVGGTPKIRIRGTSTILGNQEPLWVVDGVIQTNPTPVPNDASPISGDMEDLAQTAGNAISWLNPADIESITVLKDAASTAIYGSQAANGVIVITTKKASGGGLSVNYSGNVNVSQRPTYGLYDMMNSQEWMLFQQEMYEDRNQYTQAILPVGYGGLIQRLQNKEITVQEFEQEFRKMENMNTDWFDILFRSAVSHTHNVSVSAGGEKVQSRFSIGVNDTQGDAKGNDQLQFTASSNTTYRPNTKLSIDLSMNGSYRKVNDFAFGVDPYDYAMNTSRAIPAYNEDGSYFYHEKYGLTSHSIPQKNYYNYNILNEIENTGAETVTHTFQTNLSIRWDFLRHFQFQGDVNMSLASVNMKSWATEYSNYITSIRGYEYGSVLPNSAEELASPLPYGGLLNTQNNSTFNWSVRAAFVYNNTFKEKHRLTMNLGFQMTSNKIDGFTNMRYGYLKYRGEAYANVPTSITPVTGANSQETTLHEDMKNGSSVVNTISNQLSEYFTAVYSYDDRYVVNMNARLDASNRFGQDQNKRFNPTFSLGGKWRIGEEPFMDFAENWYDMFDISFAYGWRGNAVTAVSPYLIAQDGGIHDYFHQYYLTIKSLPYPDLGWERTRDWNAGVSFSFFKGRLSADFNYYDKYSSVLSSHDIPVEYGDLNAYIDGSIMKNRGYEFIISATPVRTKDWTWSLSFNTSREHNTVENNNRINSPEDYLTGAAIVPGESYGTFWAFDFTGLDHETGHPTFNNMDETPEDFREFLVKAGCTEPDIYGGINTSLRYKNLHLRAAFAISLGAQGWLPSYYATSGMPRPEVNVPRYMFDRWREPGDELYTDIPAIPEGNTNATYVTLYYGDDGTSQYNTSIYTMYNQSTARIANTDFIRCRSISLQYDLPKDFVNRIGMINAYVTATLTNPFVVAFDKRWEGRDPETMSWPTRRTFSISLNLSF